MSTPWLMESMKLRSESMTQNRRLVKSGIQRPCTGKGLAGLKSLTLNPKSQESLESSFGELSPGPEPLIYSNLPVRQRNKSKTRL